MDIAGARSKVENDKFCREALNKLLANTMPDGGFIDNQKLIGGKWTSVDIYDGLDRLSRANVVMTGKEGITRKGLIEEINDLSVDLGGPNLYVNSTYATRKREEKIFGLLHEALHLFSGYYDQALAVAVQKLSGVKANDIKYYSRDEKGMKEASLKLND